MKTRITRLIMLAAIAAMVVIAGSTAAWAQVQCPASFTTPSYSPDFSNTSNQLCLTLNGNYSGQSNSGYPAFTSPAPPPAAPAPAGVSTVLRLTPNAGGWAGSAWFNTAQPVASGFSTTFTFQISDTTAYNADGFAFLVQNSALTALGYRGCGVGFGYDPAGDGCSLTESIYGIPNSVAVEFKTYNDGYPSPYPNTANSVSIMNNGMAANCIDYSCLIAANNSLQVAGAVTTSGTTVTWVSGSQFNPSWTTGTAILINGVSYSIASVASTTSLTVTVAPPTYATPVQYSVGAPVAGTVSTTGTNTVNWASGSLFNTSWDPGTQILINGAAYTIASVASTTSLTVTAAPPALAGVPYSVGTILTDGNVHTVTISYTPTPTASSSPNCFSGATAEPCLDVILDGVDLFDGGVPFSMSTIGLTSGTNAWVGFTGGNAGGNDDEDILSWTFSTQSQSQTATVTPTSPATYTYNGGCNPTESGCTSNGYGNTIGENPGSSLTINNMVLTAIPIVASSGLPADSQTLCNNIVQALNPNTNTSPFVDPNSVPPQTAQCFVYQNGGGLGVDAPVMFAVSCPPSGVCDTSENQFYAALASYFNFTCAENQPLSPSDCSPSSPSSFGNFTSPLGPTSVTGLPAVGFLQGAGPDPNNPCTPATGSGALPLFLSNQIVSYTLGDTSSKPIKGGSGLLTSCWVATYDTPGVMPTATITSGPTNGATYTQNSTVTANYTCTAVSTDHDSILDPAGYPAAGPYLTVSTCTATSGLTAGGGTPTNSACSPIYPPALDSCSGTINIDTSEAGPHTLTIDVEDSATNTASQQVTYNVVGPQTIGGMVSGLSGSGLILQDNLANNLPISANGPFTFSTPIASGSGYSVTVYAQPTSPSQTCSVSSGSGTVASAPVTSVVVSCTTNSYQLTTAVSPSGGGTVSPASGNSYVWGTSVPLVATPSAGYVFSSWTGPVASPTSASTTVTVTAPVTVTANFISALTVSPSNINFGTVYLGSITAQNVTLTNIGTTALTIQDPFFSILKGGNSDEFGAVNLCPKSLGAGKSCTIIVGFLAGPYYNPQTATLSIADNAPGNPQMVMLTATVIDPQASFNPTSLSFGNQTVNTSVTRTVKLTNTGATTLSITGMTVTGTGAAEFTLTPSSNCGSSLTAGGSCTISVTFKPVAKVSYSATLNVTDNTQSGKQAVSLSGTGH